MAKYDFERTDDPEEMCELCKYKKVDGSRFCPRHGANKEIRKKASMATYEFEKDELRRKIAFLASDPLRYRLEEDLAIMRATLESLINSINLQDLYQHSDTIGTMVLRIEKVVGSCLNQAQKLGLLMTAEEFYGSIEQIINIVAEEVDDVEVIKKISARVSKALSDEEVLDTTASEDSGDRKQLGSRIS